MLGAGTQPSAVTGKQRPGAGEAGDGRGASCENGARDGGLRDPEGARPHTLKVPEHRTPNTEAIRENPSAERG